MRFRLLGLALTLFCNACGGQNAASLQAALPSSTARIIIGFDETVKSPDTAILGRELGCELRPLQSLGGNAYVYTCVTTDTEELLTRKLDKLSRHKGVRYAEMDRKRQRQN